MTAGDCIACYVRSLEQQVQQQQPPQSQFLRAYRGDVAAQQADMVLLLTEELMMSVNATHNQIHVCCVKELLRFLKAMEWRPAPAEAGNVSKLQRPQIKQDVQILKDSWQLYVRALQADHQCSDTTWIHRLSYAIPAASNSQNNTGHHQPNCMPATSLQPSLPASPFCVTCAQPGRGFVRMQQFSCCSALCIVLTLTSKLAGSAHIHHILSY